MGAAFSSAEAAALKQSWGQLKPTADKVAVDAFSTLFKAEPKYQDKFVRLRGVPVDQLETNKVLQTHGELFASSVGIMAKHADDKEVITEMVEKLAMRHQGMNLKEEDFLKASETYVGCMPQSIEKEVWQKAAKALTPKIVKRMSEMKCGSSC